LQQQLQQINEELEQRVAARTTELLEINTQLEQEGSERIRAEVMLEVRLCYTH
jgi:C4-dicarboxylate-specific signal transduction histidine kinase